MTLLDVVRQQVKELSWNSAFRALLRDLDRAAEKRVTQSFLAWVADTVETENNAGSGHDETRRG
jgi:hypothetical protein